MIASFRLKMWKFFVCVDRDAAANTWTSGSDLVNVQILAELIYG